MAIDAPIANCLLPAERCAQLAIPDTLVVDLLFQFQASAPKARRSHVPETESSRMPSGWH
ncbi:hypothetical protein [Variovorax rhizosphaerae]|uniref:Uncharacterized protein n=1 Tax=Variovorax rhizosphaerae TaxID=1836200 RepID=A0ABU8WY49_9BURK